MRTNFLSIPRAALVVMLSTMAITCRRADECLQRGCRVHPVTDGASQWEKTMGFGRGWMYAVAHSEQTGPTPALLPFIFD